MRSRSAPVLAQQPCRAAGLADSRASPAGRARRRRTRPSGAPPPARPSSSTCARSARDARAGALPAPGPLTRGRRSSARSSAARSAPGVDVGARQQPRDQALGLLEQGEQQMLGVDARCGRSAAPWSARRAAPPGSSGQTVRVHAITSCRCLRCAGAQSLLQLVDPGEQLAREHRAGVVEAQVAPQTRRARRACAASSRRNSGAAAVPAAGSISPSADEPAHELGVQARLAGERVDADQPGARARRAEPRSGGAARGRVPSAALPRIELRDVRELLEQLAFAAWSASWGHGSRRTAYRSPAGAARVAGQALAAEPQPATARGAGRHLDPGAAVERRHGHLRAERRLPRRDRQIDVQVASLDAKARDAARGGRAGTGRRAGPPPAPGAALPGQPDPLAVAHAARDLDLEVAPVAERQPPLAAAAASSSVSSSTASWSPPRIEKPVEARPAAAGPDARAAPNRPSKMSLKSPPPKSTRTSPKPSPLPKPCSNPPRAGHVLARPPVRAEAVVARALLGVAQDLVGLGDLLEAVLGAGLLVDVRVIFARELAVGAADVLGARVARNAQRLVVVLEGDRPSARVLGRARDHDLRRADHALAEREARTAAPSRIVRSGSSCRRLHRDRLMALGIEPLAGRPDPLDALLARGRRPSAPCTALQTVAARPSGSICIARSTLSTTSSQSLSIDSLDLRHAGARFRAPSACGSCRGPPARACSDPRSAPARVGLAGRARAALSVPAARLGIVVVSGRSCRGGSPGRVLNSRVNSASTTSSSARSAGTRRRRCAPARCRRCRPRPAAARSRAGCDAAAGGRRSAGARGRARPAPRGALRASATSCSARAFSFTGRRSCSSPSS